MPASQARIDALYNLLLDYAKQGKQAPPLARIAAAFDPPLSKAALQTCLANLRIARRITSERVGGITIYTMIAYGISTAHAPQSVPKYDRYANKAYMVKELTDQGLSQSRIASILHICGRSVKKLQAEMCGIASEPKQPSRHKQNARNYKHGLVKDGSIPDEDLYGSLAGDIARLRKFYRPVCKSETMGLPPGEYVVGKRVVAPREIPVLANRLARPTQLPRPPAT